MNAGTSILFFFSGIAFLSLLGIFFFSKMPSDTWRRGIWLGMAGSGYSMIGYGLPLLNAVPTFTFICSMAIMLALIAYAYYKHPNSLDLTPEQVASSEQHKQGSVVKISIGFAFLLFLTVLVGYTSGQKEGQELTGSFAKVVYQLSKEVKTLGIAVKELRGDVEELKQGQKAGAANDSANQKTAKQDRAYIKQHLNKRR